MHLYEKGDGQLVWLAGRTKSVRNDIWAKHERSVKICNVLTENDLLATNLLVKFAVGPKVKCVTYCRRRRMQC